MILPLCTNLSTGVNLPCAGLIEGGKIRMKFLQLFNKTPKTRGFNYKPRFYNAEEEERKERIARIEREVKGSMENVTVPKADSDPFGHRTRMRGAFRQGAENEASKSPSQTSPMLMRLVILLVLTVGFIGYLQYGRNVLYALALIIIPFVLYSRLQSLKKKGR